MSTFRIENTGRTHLTLPSGVTVPARGTADEQVEGFAAYRDLPVVRAWFDGGTLQGEPPEVETPPAEPVVAKAADGKFEVRRGDEVVASGLTKAEAEAKIADLAKA